MLYQSGVGLILSENYLQPDLSRDTTCPMGKSLLVKTGMVFKNIFEAIIQDDTATEVSCKALAPDEVLIFW